MKERTPEQLKGQIRSFAGKRNLQSQEVLQMFYWNVYWTDYRSPDIKTILS